MTKKDYLAPEVTEISLHLESSVLSGSYEFTTGNSTGEGVTWGDEFDPWN